MKLTFKKEINKVNLERAINIFSISFSGLFEKRIPDNLERKALYKLILEAEDVIYAYDEKGKVVAICGVGTKENSSKAVKVKDLRKLLGFSVAVVFASFFDNRKDVKKDELYISFLAVDKKNRRRKIGTKFLTYIASYSIELSKTSILVDDVPSNIAGVNLFKKFGFEFSEEKETKRYKKGFGITFDKYSRYRKIL